VFGSAPDLLAAGGADVVLVTGSSYPAATECLPALRPNGRMVLAGIDPTGSFTIPPSLARPFFAQRQQIIGSTHNGQHLLREALDLAASGQVRPQVQTFAASEVATAVNHVARGEALFRAVVTF
jgi:alcohol dehydrogenase/propanol-preferring alcohol dehydrogenase